MINTPWNTFCYIICILISLTYSNANPNSFLKVFKNCTLHFFDIAIPVEFVEKSTFTLSDFLHSTNLYTYQKTFVPHTSTGKKIYSDYINIFKPIKFHGICVVHVFAMPKDWIKFTPGRIVHSYTLYSQFSVIFVQYILMLIRTTSLACNYDARETHFHTSHYPMWRWTPKIIISLECKTDDPIVTTLCFTCDAWKKSSKYDLFKISITPKSLFELSNELKSFDFQFINKEHFSNHKESVLRFVQCEAEFLAVDEIEQTRFRADHGSRFCAFSIIMSKFNCSIKCMTDFRRIIFLQEEFRFLFGRPVYLSHAATFTGYKYMTFVNRIDQRTSGSILYILTSLNPWRLVEALGVILLMGMFLRISGNRNTALWVTAALIGMGFVELKHRSVALIVWLFAGCIIKELLSSEMISSLTSQQKPKDVRDTFRDLIYNSTVLTIASPDIRIISDIYRLYDENVTKEYLNYRNIIKRTALFYSGDISKYLKEGLCESRLKRKKPITLDKLDFTEVKGIANNYLDRNMTIEIVELRTFAIIYQTYPIKVYGTINKILPDIASCSMHRIFKNNNPIMFSDIRVWRFNENSFILGWFEERLARLVASGMWDKVLLFYKNLLMKTNLEDSMPANTTNKTISNAIAWLTEQSTSETEDINRNNEIDDTGQVSLEGLFTIFNAYISALLITIGIFLREVVL